MKDKRFFLTSALSLLIFTAMAQVKPFVIKGKIADKADGFIYLQYQNGDQQLVTDSARINNGAFIFNGAVDGVTRATVKSGLLRTLQDNTFQIFISPGSQMVTVPSGDFANGYLSGTPVAEDLKKFKELRKDVQPKVDQFTRDYNAASYALAKATRDKADTQMIDKLKADQIKLGTTYAEISKQIQEKDLEFMNAYPNSYVTAWLLIGKVKTSDFRERYVKLSPEIVNSNVGKELIYAMNKGKLGTVGVVAPLFAATELRGGEVRLADYKGKYVLLDFWASWCVPCRKGNPHLLSLYSQYKEKGFEIIGISDDDKMVGQWKKAVEQDQIGVWKHVLRGLKFQGDGTDKSNSIMDKYNVASLPTKILIDPNGIIIGRYGGGGGNDADMDKKLAEIFGS